MKHQLLSVVRVSQTLPGLLCRDHGSRARLQQEAGGSIVRSVSGATAVSPGSHRGVLRGHQEEGGRNCTFKNRQRLNDTSRSSFLKQDFVILAQLEAFEVNVSPDLQQQLACVVQELGVSVPPPVSRMKVFALAVQCLSIEPTLQRQHVANKAVCCDESEVCRADVRGRTHETSETLFSAPDCRCDVVMLFKANCHRQNKRSVYIRFSNMKVFMFQPADSSSPVSLVQGKLAYFEPSQRQTGAGVVPWSPPQVNWNPWTSSNIDEGPLAYVSLTNPETLK